MKFNQIIQGDIRTVARELPDQSVNCICTSPPYFGLRNYEVKDQMGLEESPEAYVSELVGVFRELRRVLRDDGTLWLVIGDSYASTIKGSGGLGASLTLGIDADGKSRMSNANRLRANRRAAFDPRKIDLNGLKPKDLIGIPWRVALALQADGWYLRSDIIWSKPNPMPESVTDRPTKAHEYIFLLSKSPRYYFDQEAVREPHKDLLPDGKRTGGGMPKGVWVNAPNGIKQGEGNAHNPSGRNKRTVWQVATQPYADAHFAVFPPKLIEPCILAGCPSRVCAECGEPWRREVEKGFTSHDGGTNSAYDKGTTAHRLAKLRQAARLKGGEYANTTKTIGFSPQCQCNAPHRPGVVLDPFFGSGTVAQVAIETGRDWLGVELNPDYIELAEKRIVGTQPALFAPDEAMNGNAKAKQLTLTLDEE